MKPKLFIVIVLLLFGSTMFAQKIITGNVKDSNGVALAGATIIEKGTSNGTTSDFDGNFTLEVSGNDAIIQVTYIGFAAKEISTTDQSNFSIQLEEEVTSLDDVVVIGYGTAVKRDITTAVVSVDASKIPSASNSGVTDLLFGKAAGVQVSQASSQPGGRVDLSIRGRGNPLIVVDGVIVPSNSLESGVNLGEIDNVNRGNLGGLNPNDIESIEILKDASASIYGVNASNGVILITTKKGKLGKLNVSVDYSHSALSNAKYLEPLNAREYMEFYNRFDEDRYLSQNNMQPFGPEIPSGYEPHFSDSQINNNTVDTDWVDQILRSGFIDNLNMNVRGGTEKTTYYFSGGVFNQEGTVKNSDMERYSGKLDLSFQILPFAKLNVGAIGNLSRFGNSVAGWQTGGAGQNAYTALQAALAYPAYLPIRDPDTGAYTQFQLIGNPVAQLDIRDKTKNTSILTTTSLDLDIIPEVLTGKILYGYNSESSFRDFFIPSTTNWFDDYRSRASLQNSTRERQTFETYLTFAKEISVVKFNAVAGFGEYTDQGMGFGVQAFDMLDAINTTNITGAPSNGNSWKYINKLRSYFARGTFNILDRYLVEAAIRYDGYSQFFPDSKYAAFPSVSAGWKISSEPFFEGLTETFELLKLRGSLGTTGQNLPSGVAYGFYSPDGEIISFNDGNSNYVPYILSQLDDPNLTWQKTIMQNIGLDFEMFHGRLYGSVEWYQDRITNLLRYGNTAVNTPPLSSIATRPANGGEQKREGYEITLGGDIIRNNDLRWTVNVNFSHYDFNWVERFEEDDPSWYLNEDDPVMGIYAFETNGIIQTGETISDYQPSTASMAGAPRFVDQNGDNVLDRNDVRIYDQVPDFTYGLTTTLTYKRFDFSTSLYGQVGAYRQNYSLNWANPLYLLNGTAAGNSDSYNVWSTQNPNGSLPGASYDEFLLGSIGDTVGWGSDVTVSKADFLRMRNITLGYTLGSDQFKSVFFNDLRIYVDVQNPFIITNYKGADPEVQTPAVKGGAAPYPIVKSIAIGLNLNF